MDKAGFVQEIEEMKMAREVHIPDNILEFIQSHDGVNLSINLSSASANLGYGHMFFYTVVISMFTKTCGNCGYDIIWKPELWESKCNRHRYGSERYDTVFAWSSKNDGISLGKAFDDWMKNQKKNKAIKYKLYGQFGFEK